MLSQIAISSLMLKIMTKILISKSTIMLKYQNKKIFLQRALLQIAIKDVKKLYHGHILSMISAVKKFWERFTKKSYKRYSNSI